jgi:hypothetical protein
VAAPSSIADRPALPADIPVGLVPAWVDPDRCPDVAPCTPRAPLPVALQVPEVVPAWDLAPVLVRVQDLASVPAPAVQA